MSYNSIDPTINAWATRHALYFFTHYREEEVRSVDLVGSDGQRCQLWIEAPDKIGDIQVHVWDYKKRKCDYKTTMPELTQCLDQAYKTAMKWLC